MLLLQVLQELFTQRSWVVTSGGMRPLRWPVVQYGDPDCPLPWQSSSGLAPRVSGLP
jgi:hypothetical protein